MSAASEILRRRVFHFVMIKPSHYDDDGQVIQWLRSVMPSNTLAAIYGLAADCARRRILGDDVEIRLSARDETNAHIDVDRIIRDISGTGGDGLVALVGVQSNQFPRALDISRPLRRAGIAVAIGGFHVSGCIAMLPEIPQDIREAQDLGIILFAGEAEERRLDLLLRDVFHCNPQPIYNFMADLPNLAGEVTPFLPIERLERTAGAFTTFDAGRGCPFQCSFCTIINVQGRKSRYRSADDIERIVRENLAQGVDAFFITDDNFARNRQWEAAFDRLIALREGEGLPIRLIIQVDTLCHKIPNFIEKASRAGVCQVFIGLENINPENLLAAKKRQNRIDEYRRMLLAWKSVAIMTFAGYILGFPADTPQSVRRDIEIIKRELPVDFLEFFILTPLPGSEDHRQLWSRGQWMDPDMNKYDLNHVTTAHPTMSSGELQVAWRNAWRDFYTVAHMTTMLRRAATCGIPLGKMIFMQVWFYASIRLSGIHPLEAGYFRIKRRRERRPGMPLESVLQFYPRYLWELVSTHFGVAAVGFRLWIAAILIALDPRRKGYEDRSCADRQDEDADEIGEFDAMVAADASRKQPRATPALPQVAGR